MTFTHDELNAIRAGCRARREALLVELAHVKAERAMGRGSSRSAVVICSELDAVETARAKIDAAQEAVAVSQAA